MRFVDKRLLFSSSFITLTLSWCRIVVVLYLWPSTKCFVQIIFPMQLSTPIISASVDLWALHLCFCHTFIISPLPSVITLPVCPLMSRCTANEASTHHSITSKLLALSASRSPGFLFR